MSASYEHPYRHLPATSFWKQAVAEIALDSFDPVVEPAFTITKTETVATAGSCFAQHISRALIAGGFNFLNAEPPDARAALNSATFSARYGNIYTCLQLRQLFERAYGLFLPVDTAWRRPDGRYVDPFRPTEFPEGFASVEDVLVARETHLAAVRRVFETCGVFVFTLGLTESWIAGADGAALPIPPGVVGAPEEQRTYEPVNQDVDVMRNDMLRFVDYLRSVNPAVRIILTVSPVPLVATFERQHVLVSNTFSKSTLRVVADYVSKQRANVMYFPSYEIVAAMPRIDAFERDFRSVRSETVDFVLSIFKARCCESRPGAAQTARAPSRDGQIADGAPGARGAGPSQGLGPVICDEELLGTG